MKNQGLDWDSNFSVVTKLAGGRASIHPFPLHYVPDHLHSVFISYLFLNLLNFLILWFIWKESILSSD